MAPRVPPPRRPEVLSDLESRRPAVQSPPTRAAAEHGSPSRSRPRTSSSPSSAPESKLQRKRRARERFVSALLAPILIAAVVAIVMGLIRVDWAGAVHSYSSAAVTASSELASRTKSTWEELPQIATRVAREIKREIIAPLMPPVILWLVVQLVMKTPLLRRELGVEFLRYSGALVILLAFLLSVVFSASGWAALVLSVSVYGPIIFIALAIQALIRHTKARSE
jgi:hypothetical protein